KNADITAQGGVRHERGRMGGVRRVATSSELDRGSGSRITWAYVILDGNAPWRIVGRVHDRQIQADGPIEVFIFQVRQHQCEETPSGAAFGREGVAVAGGQAPARV